MQMKLMVFNWFLLIYSLKAVRLAVKLQIKRNKAENSLVTIESLTYVL